MNMKNPSVVSLFCGAGGLDMGFEHAGFHVIWANDVDHDACETHRCWSDADVVEGDIGKVDFSTIPDATVIIGGFPCQGFSLAGSRKIDDSRNVLYQHFVKLVGLKRPMVFVAENVKGILTMCGGAVMDAIIEDFHNKGYSVSYQLINAADYGVPQDRARVIIIGIRNDIDDVFTMPEPFDVRVTLHDVLSAVPLPEVDDVCMASYSSRYMSRNRKRGWDDVSFTIPAMAKQVPLYPGSPDMVFIGQDSWSFGSGGITRRLSYQEAAAIQTFPLGMEFCGDLTSKYKQIGNAVPVRLAEIVGREVYRIVSNTSITIC